MVSWTSRNNQLGNDFKLFSSLKDAKADRNEWGYCNYDDDNQGIGFPYDCGPEK